MGRHTLEGNPPIDVILRRSARAKRLSLRVSRLDGRVTLTLPVACRTREGIAFLQDREEWLRGHLDRIAPETSVAIGQTVLFEGRMIPIVAGTTRKARLENDQVVVPAGDAVAAHIKALFKATARDRLAAASDHFAGLVGRSFDRLSIRDTRSRWGSCSSKGALMYSWRLIMAPPPVLQYVAAHEVSHLVEMNHSQAFWSVVESIYPDYAPCRRWLRENGEQLHRVRFDD